MPTIHKMFLLKMVLFTAGFAVVLVGAHTVQARRIPDALKNQADRAADVGKPDAAVRYLRQYLEFRPDDVDAREQLATLLRERPGVSPSDLLLLYDKVLRMDPARHAVRREALTACLRIGRWTDAETHAEALLTVFGTDAELWQKLAAAQAGLQKSAEARQSYEAAVRHAPTDPLPYQRLAQYLYRDLKQPQDAKAVVERLVAALPLSAESYVTRAKFALSAGDAAAATTDLQKSLGLDPAHAEGRLLLAEQLQKQRKLADARDCLAAGMKHNPEDVRFIRGLAWLELNRGNIGASVAVLEDGIAHVKDGFDLLVPLADLLVQLGETARTEEIVARLEKQPTPESRMQAKYLKARIAMRNADWATATELLTSLRTEAIKLPGLEAQTNLLLSVCYQRQANITHEQDTLRLVLNKDPNHLTARVTLAQSYLNTGRIADAIQEYEQAVLSPFANPATHATLLRLKMRTLTLNHGSTQEWQHLERVAGELAKAFPPSSSEPILLRSELATARGDRTQAAVILRAEAARRPGDDRVWAALARAVANIAGVSTGLGVLDEAQAAAGDGPSLRLARADLYARDPARLRPLDPLMSHTDGWPDAEQTQLLYGMVEVHDRLGDDARLVQMYRKIAARRPGDLTIWEALGEKALATGDEHAAAEARKAALNLDPSGKSAALFDAWAAAAEKSNDSTRSVVDRLVQAFGTAPERADVCVVLARLRERDGERAEAGRLYERSVRLEPTRISPMQAYLSYLTRIGAADAVAAVLNRLASDHRWAGDAFRHVVRGTLRHLPSDRSTVLLAAARRFVESEPGGLGWLGDAYLACGMNDEASRCFREATATPSVSPDDWLRFAVRTAESGATNDAMATLKRARDKLPAGLFFATAAAFTESAAAPKDWKPVLNSAIEKRVFAQARLSIRLSRFQQSEAVTLLDQFLMDDPPKADAAWARRNLAMLLAIRGGKADRTRAMELLVKSDDDSGTTPDEKRSTAAVLTALSRHLDGPDRKAVTDRATAVLEALVADTRSPRDAFLLAQVFRAAGNRQASTVVLNKLLEADPKNPEFLMMGLSELTELGDFTAAEPFAQRLIQLYPTDYRTVAAVARYEVRAGRPEKALSLAEGYTRTADATAGDLPAKSARAAELLDELARSPKIRRTDIGKSMARAAITKYEALIPVRPEAVVPAAGLLAFDERPTDAFALIDKHAKKLTPRLKVAAGLAVLRAGGAADRQFERVQSWLDAAVADEPDAVALLLHQGEFFGLKQDHAAAEKAYQAVLDRDPRNVVALNNLAWVLAPRPEAAARALELVDRAVSEVGLTGELLDTRARVRIAAKQFDLAEKDLVEALAQERTPLRMFHLALAKRGQSPGGSDEARDAFRTAKERGLDPRSVHPEDLPMYRVLDTASTERP